MQRLYKVDLQTVAGEYGFGQMSFLHTKSFSETDFHSQASTALAAARKSVGSDRTALPAAFAGKMREMFGYEAVHLQASISVEA